MVLPQPMRQVERLGDQVEPPRRRRWCAPGRDCEVFLGNYCIDREGAFLCRGTNDRVGHSQGEIFVKNLDERSDALREIGRGHEQFRVDATGTFRRRVNSIGVVGGDEEYQPLPITKFMELGEHAWGHKLEHVSLLAVELRVPVQDQAVDLVEQHHRLRLFPQHVEDCLGPHLHLRHALGHEVARGNHYQRPSEGFCQGFRNPGFPSTRWTVEECRKMRRLLPWCVSPCQEVIFDTAVDPVFACIGAVAERFGSLELGRPVIGCRA